MSVGDIGKKRETLIEAGTAFKGSFASDCPIVVKGRIEGDLSGPSLTVSSTGAVSGTVKVKELRSDGELSGEYDAEVVHLSGVVKDNTIIRAKHLEVKLSPERGRLQVVFGECELEVGDVPSKEDSLAEHDSKHAKPVLTSPDETNPGLDLGTSNGGSDAADTPKDRGLAKNRRTSTVPPGS
jgi:cytoskeletal protein CcmA (bactofilin family)